MASLKSGRQKAESGGNMQYILQSLVSDAQIAVGFVLGTIFVTTVTLVRMTLKAGR